MAPASTPAPIRILLQYQLPASMASGSKELVQKTVAAAISTLQGYVQV